MRMPIADKESFEPQHVAIVDAADDHGPTGTRLDQPDPAQDQGAHDPLAQFGLFHQKIAQPARRNDECLDGLPGVGIHQTRPIRQLGKLAHERAWTVGHDRLGMSQHSTLRDIDLAREDDEGARCNFAGCNEAFACRIGFALTEPCQPIDLRRLQHREHLIAAGFDQRTFGWRHRFPHGRAGCTLMQPFSPVNTICAVSAAPIRPASDFA
jgi:hypothetical protein